MPRDDKARAADRAYYAKSAYRKAAIRARNRNQSAILRAAAINYLWEHPCVDCGESDVIVLEFDHRENSNKKYDISKGVGNGISVAKLMIEIEKCDVRCANCHRRKTTKQLWPHKQRHADILGKKERPG